MDNVGLLLAGFESALQWQYLGYAFLGVLLGTAVGVLPGIGPAMTVALLLPLTYNLDATAAFIMFAGIYYGGMYGGSTTSILLNTPGESASIITTIEGTAMARAGRGAAALATAALGSFVAGTLGTLGLTFLGPFAARYAVELSSADYVALMVVAFMTVGALLGSSPLRGIASLAIGLVLGMVGVDSLSAQARFTFEVPQLLDGVDVVLVAVGLFAVGETLWTAARLRHGHIALASVKGQKWFTREDLRRSWKPWIRGAAIGFPIGTIPAGGADVSTFLSYAAEKRLARGAAKAQFGKGAIEGVAGPEAANNAAAAGVLVPLLTLGLPTSATAAIMLAAFQRYNIDPGPGLFESNSALVWALIASLYIGNVILLVLNLPLVGMWAKLLQIPRHYLYAGILTFAALGAFALNLQTADLILLVALGILGYLMRRFDYPVAPMVIGLILGPIFEAQLRRALSISQGDPVALVTHPFAAIAYSLLAVFIAGSLLLRRRERLANEAALADSAESASGESDSDAPGNAEIEDARSI